MSNPRVQLAWGCIRCVFLLLVCFQQPVGAAENEGRIVYVGSGDLWTMNPDGSDKQPLGIKGNSPNYPSWSPDGRQIVFQHRTNRIYPDFLLSIVNADGSGLRQLTHLPEGVQRTIQDQHPAWSPDGRWIAFQSNRDEGYDIFLVDPSGNNLTNLTNSPETNEGTLDWSPNGEKIVYVANQNFHTIRVADKQVEQLTDNRVSRGFPAWSPDGTQIAFASERNDNPDIFVIDADGNNERQLTFRSHLDWKPSWSPDGTQLVFYATSPTGGRPDIFLLTIATSEVGNITNAEDLARYSPDWSRAVSVPTSVEPAHLKRVRWGEVKSGSTGKR